MKADLQFCSLGDLFLAFRTQMIMKFGQENFVIRAMEQKSYDTYILHLARRNTAITPTRGIQLVKWQLGSPQNVVKFVTNPRRP